MTCPFGRKIDVIYRIIKKYFEIRSAGYRSTLIFAAEKQCFFGFGRAKARLRY